MSKTRLVRLLAWGAVATALAVPVASALRAGAGGTEARATLGDYGTVPEFRLVERSGKPLSRSDLAGSPWVASFLFTRCQGTCPSLATAMARLEKRVHGRARLVSFSVDPANDTPRRLTEYATRFGASPADWLFVTGDPTALRELVSRGFQLSFADRGSGHEGDALTHSSRVALVDADLRIRGYYLATENDWMDRLLHDLEVLGSEAG